MRFAREGIGGEVHPEAVCFVDVNSEFGIRSSEFGIRNSEFGVGNSELGVGNWESIWMLKRQIKKCPELRFGAF